MHQKRSVRDVYYLDPVDIPQRSDNFLIVFFRRSVYGYIADQKIFTDADYIDALDVAAGASDGRRYLTELSRKVMNSDA
jgi:hypothetical protein